MPSMMLRASSRPACARLQTVRAVQPRISARPMMNRRMSVRVMAKADKDSVLSDVITIVAEQLGKDSKDIKASSDFVQDLQADSLDTVEIMMALEEKFEFDIKEEDAGKVQTVQQVVDMIVARLDDPDSKKKE